MKRIPLFGPALLLAVLLPITAPSDVVADQTAEGPRKKLAAFRPLKTDTPPVIDGLLGEEVWKQAPSETGFMTWYPDFGAEMSEQTVVWYAYDEENLYFAFRCYDSQPRLIRSSVHPRDQNRSDDWVCLNLDTFNDQQGLSTFYINPAGTQTDGRATPTGEDLSVDMVWYSEGNIDEQGYTIEVQIPFKSLRYTAREPVEMGVIFERMISRKSEGGTYPALDPARGPDFITQTRPLLYEGIRHYRLVEIIPAVTHGRGQEAVGPTLGSEDIRSEVSLTAKYGITSHLVLDATINPDFSQVEADAGQVDFNQRFALFYDEKRPFFLEGREQFATAAANLGTYLRTPVHTRQIVDPRFGARLTGKVGDRNTVAAILARDEILDPAVGEFADFAILRYKRALDQDSYLGGVYTGREADTRSNRVLGVDGKLRLTGASSIAGNAFLSRTDQGGTTTDGWSLALQYYYQDRDLIVGGGAIDLSADFQTDAGYVTRMGISAYDVRVTPLLYPSPEWMLRFDPSVYVGVRRDHASGLIEESYQFHNTLHMARSTRLSVGGDVSNEVFLGERFGVGGYQVQLVSQFDRRFSVFLFARQGQRIRYVADPYPGFGSTVAVNLGYQPTIHLSSSINLTYTDFTRDSDDVQEYDYTILRSRTSYQVNKYLFFRGIIEHNAFRDEVLTDLLVSFTYIPGTVMHLGYGSLYREQRWDGTSYVPADDFMETRRGIFFKASYLWRM